MKEVGTSLHKTFIVFKGLRAIHNWTLIISARDLVHDFSVKFSPSLCVPIVASLNDISQWNW